MSVLVVLEQRGGKWNRMSFEALAAGQKLAAALSEPVEAVVLGSNIDALTGEAAAYDVAKVFALEHPLLGEYTPDAYTAALEQLITAQKPKAIVFPHTYEVRDYAPKLSTRLGKTLVSDVVDVKIVDGGQPVFVRQLFQGKLNADVRVESEPQFISVQAGAFRAAESGGGQATVEKFALQLDPALIRSKPEQPFREAQRSIDLGAAGIIVSVGRGIKEKGICPSSRNSQPLWARSWLPRGRSVTTAGCRWNARSAVRARRYLRRCTWLWESQAQFSIWSG